MSKKKNILKIMLYALVLLIIGYCVFIAKKIEI